MPGALAAMLSMPSCGVDVHEVRQLNRCFARYAQRQRLHSLHITNRLALTCTP